MITGPTHLSGAATPPTWVVGAGGLLGRALVRRLRGRGSAVVVGSIPWGDPAAAEQALRLGFDRLTTLAAGGPWRVAWCAGAGVTGTSAAVLDQEVATYTSALDWIAGVGSVPTGSGLFMASSAGGVYAGTGQAPFSERDVAAAISPYGSAKLRMEAVTTDFAQATGAAVLIGRIANLYGPGQNLAKPQGLISHLCRAQLSGKPISIYVPLDTTRDYLYVDDCADIVADGLDRVAHTAGGLPVIKIIASQQGVTIGALLAECRRIFKRAPRVVLGSSPFARYQVRDLRLRSRVWPELDRRTLAPLGSGIKATADDLLRAFALHGPPRH